jgi:outer membrane biogenesis lipoprotein LolB
MKRTSHFVGLSIAFALAACSASTPQDQLASIDELVAKNFPMTEQQRMDLDKYLADGKNLLQNGKEAEASTAFGEALKILKLAQDTDLYNKSE